jgi:hypothetical protein
VAEVDASYTGRYLREVLGGTKVTAKASKPRPSGRK